MRPRDEHLPLETLSAFIDGELDRDELAAAEAHLGLCPACSGKAEDLRRLAAEIAGDPVPPVPPGLVGLLGQRLDAYEAGTRTADGEPLRSRRRERALRPWRWHGAPLAAAAAILAAGLLWRFWLAAPGPVSPVRPVSQPATEAPGGRQVAAPPGVSPRRMDQEKDAGAVPTLEPGETERLRSLGYVMEEPDPGSADGDGQQPGRGVQPPPPPALAFSEAESREKAAPESAGVLQAAPDAPPGTRASALRAMAAGLDGASLLLREGEARIRLHETGRLEVAEGDYSCVLEPAAESEAGELIGQRLRQDPDLRQRAVREGAGIDPGLRDLLLRLVRVERRAELEAACGPLPATLAGEME